MNESGPVRKTDEDRNPDGEYADIQQIARNTWCAVRDGKRLLLKTAAGADAASRRLLRREYELTRGLQHPYIVPVFQFEPESPVGPAIVMEYVEGRTLRAFVAEKPDANSRKKVLLELLDAVEYLHRKGLLHNDLKPENVLVTAVSNDVKLIDFGLAENDADYLHQRLGGTPGATAPEVFEGDPSQRSTAAADIYAIGGMLSLLFPNRYRKQARRCLRNAPAGRYPDVASLRRALARRDRAPLLITLPLIALALLAAVWLPGHIRAAREKAAAEAAATTAAQARQALIDEVQGTLQAWYDAAIDTLHDSAIVPYKESAYLVLNHFTLRTLEYRKTLDSARIAVYDTVYERLGSQFFEEIAALPAKPRKGIAP